MISDKVINIKSPQCYSSWSGFFSTATYTNKEFIHNAEFDHCREVFANRFKSNTHFIIFTRRNINIDLINKFFEGIEDKLNVKRPTIFHKLRNKGAVLIELSPFWKENALRRGIFTLFLRCAACYYDGEDIYKSLVKYNLTKKIIGPIEWFMKNNTKLSVSVDSGWVVSKLATFSRKEWESVLVK